MMPELKILFAFCLQRTKMAERGLFFGLCLGAMAGANFPWRVLDSDDEK